MKICMIGQKGIPTRFGGIERHAEELSAALVLLGHRVVVYTRPHYTDPRLTSYRGVRLVSLPSIHSKHLDAITHTFLATLHALFVEPGVEVIHYHGVGPALLSWLPRLLKPSVKVVVTFHCVDALHAKWGQLAKASLRLGEWLSVRVPHATIAVSKALRHYCQTKFDRAPAYIPSGVSSQEEFLASDEFKARFGLTPKRYVLTVQRLVAHKGIHWLLAAWAKVPTDWPLVIVGDGSFTDDYVKRLKMTAASLERPVLFLGYRQGAELNSLIKEAYLFVSPSAAEGLPIVVLEAMNLGTPALLSDIPEHLEIIRPLDDIAFGHTFVSQDVSSLAKALVELLAVDPAVLAKTAALGQRHVQTHYQWDSIAEQVSDLYGRLLKPDQPTLVVRKKLAH